MSKLFLYCEGDTEEAILKPLLDPFVRELAALGVGVKVLNMHGISHFYSDIGKSVIRAVDASGAIAVLGVVDLFRAVNEFPTAAVEVSQKAAYVRQTLKEAVPRSHRKYFHPHVAIQETEAWLLADETAVRAVLKSEDGPWPSPEAVGHPAQVLEDLYRRHKKRSYQKVPDGMALANKVDPERIYARCPAFQRLVNDLRKAARPRKQH